ncbi:MAG: hypothetical protein NTY19_07365 [Planctomycetota bacterium]|nr:hypothetical protein [Planctomycetota bacterium]
MPPPHALRCVQSAPPNGLTFATSVVDLPALLSVVDINGSATTGNGEYSRIAAKLGGTLNAPSLQVASGVYFDLDATMGASCRQRVVDGLRPYGIRPGLFHGVGFWPMMRLIQVLTGHGSYDAIGDQHLRY